MCITEVMILMYVCIGTWLHAGYYRGYIKITLNYFISEDSTF